MLVSGNKRHSSGDYKMNKSYYVLGAIALWTMSSSLAFAQQGRGPQGPQQPMSFFVTSSGSGKGADLGGLAGADAICDARAKSVGSTKTFHAYLSTQSDSPRTVVNARDRIGLGPWYNAKGQLVARSLEELHGDTLQLARLGNAISKATVLTEKGETPKGFGDMPNEHDILTGSRPDGTAYPDAADHTCNNWTSSTTGSSQLGHFDRTGGGNSSWNSAHPSRGCSQEGLVSTGGAGLLYCFAIN
jgi:hypothetical protein